LLTVLFIIFESKLTARFMSIYNIFPAKIAFTYKLLKNSYLVLLNYNNVRLFNASNFYVAV
jgi:hypothetical protein